MARKDDILQSFLQHEILRDKYELQENDLPHTLREGLQSEIPIVKAISLIVESLEASSSTTDKQLQNLVTQYLNSVAK